MPGEMTAPAARYLREDERWRPRTWRHFRYAVLKRLRDHGAQSIEEIAATPPWVLFLPLSRREVIAVVDSARRLGLITPLDASASLESLDPRRQWVVTEAGRRTIRHGLPWVFDKLGALSKWGSILAMIAGLISAGAVIKWLHERDGAEIVFGVEACIYLLWGAGSLALLLRSVSAGARARRTTSQDWQRWQQERPEWSKIAARRFPRWRTASAISVFVLLEAALFVLDQDGLWTQALPWIALLALAFPAMIWFARWNDIEAAAAELKKQEEA
jgi:hypothetical protein